MKQVLLFFLLPLGLLAQTEIDSTLTQEELHFRDSIAALNVANEQTQLLQETYNQATTHFSAKEFSQAVQHYTQVIMMDSLYMEAYFNRGLAHKEQQKYSLAIADLNQTFALDSSHSEALFQIAKCWHLQTNYPAAIKAYQLVLS